MNGAALTRGSAAGLGAGGGGRIMEARAPSNANLFMGYLEQEAGAPYYANLFMVYFEQEAGAPLCQSVHGLL